MTGTGAPDALPALDVLEAAVQTERPSLLPQAALL
jgi:hypothetical protein